MKFALREMFRELQLIELLGDAFIERDSLVRLSRAAYELRSLPIGVEKCWAIDVPIRTLTSHGQYASDRGGGLDVHAEIATTWSVKRLDTKTIQVVDNVSTTVAFVSKDVPIAAWTMDIAAVASAPGCGIHTQVKGIDTWFPSSIDVPRIPTFIPTLGAVIEYVLGELFQKEWPEAVSKHANSNGWRELQSRAWRRWLTWQLATTSDSTVSPWLDLKSARCDGLDDHLSY